MWALLAAFSLIHGEYLKENAFLWLLQVKVSSSLSGMARKGFYKDMDPLKRAQRKESRIIRCLETRDLQGKVTEIWIAYSKRALDRMW